MTHDPDHHDHSWHNDTPSPRHWMGYTVIKIVILILALILAVYLLGLL